MTALVITNCTGRLNAFTLQCHRASYSHLSDVQTKSRPLFLEYTIRVIRYFTVLLGMVDNLLRFDARLCGHGY